MQDQGLSKEKQGCQAVNIRSQSPKKKERLLQVDEGVLESEREREGLAGLK